VIKYKRTKGKSTNNCLMYTEQQQPTYEDVRKIPSKICDASLIHWYIRGHEDEKYFSYTFMRASR